MEPGKGNWVIRLLNYWVIGLLEWDGFDYGNENMFLKIWISLCLLGFGFSSAAAGNAHFKYYFYHPETEYGSEAMLTPLETVLNGSYDVLRNGSHENNGETIDVFRLDYRQGFSTVWENITSPGKHINRYGRKRFLSNEVFPTSFNPDHAQWVPNYGHHIIGSGILWVRMAEWYDYHGFSHPFLWSFVSTTAYQLMNEVLENNHFKGSNVDPIADLLIFNPLGFLLFSFDSVREFFSQTVRMYDWSLQPLYNPQNHYIENAGLQFTFKYTISEDFDFFFYYGIYGLGGLSYQLGKGYHLSLGGGTVVNRLNYHDEQNTRLTTPSTESAAGIFIDRNHSLLASAVVTAPKLWNIRLNIYPGWFNAGGFSPGLYVGAGEWDGLVAGITFRSFPIGLLTEWCTDWKK